MPWLTRQVLSWAMFDVMTSIYAGLVPSLAFPLYFERHVVSGPGAGQAWGLLVAAGVAASAVAALCGVALSRRLSRYTVLAAAIAGMIAALVVLSIDRYATFWIVAAAYIVAQCCYFAAAALYDSCLPEIAPRGFTGRVSGFGWSLGYLGGIAAAAVLIVYAGPGSEDAALFRWLFAVIAVMTALLAIPVFAGRQWRRMNGGGPSKTGPRWTGIGELLRRWRTHRRAAILLVAISLLQAITVFVLAFTAPLLVKTFGQSLRDLLWMVLVLHVLAIPATLLCSFHFDLVSRRSSVFAVMAGWAAILLLLAFAPWPWTPWLIVCLLACSVGATNAALRSLLSEAVPADSAVAYFGLAAFAARIASALGPLLFVAVSGLAGERAGLLAMLVPLAASAAMLHRLQPRSL